MPHLILHYTANLEGFDPDRALARINQALADSGHFNEADIKSRALRLDRYRIGTAESGRGFVHAQLKVLPGRDAALRKALSDTVLSVLRELLPAHHPESQLCVEVDELDAGAYTKHAFAANLP
ncbi:5-carboxymethyl-2-hydroxymuconate Delta-isomerase [Lysobacter sp. CA199]|uniref:5-carboxymethyl-2-hydroxymuconate Delta-isomerase n=1 Tax=Lysobacter sp. CA199 TaxID=3455608 RepID=UPI003F8D37DA